MTAIAVLPRWKWNSRFTIISTTECQRNGRTLWRANPLYVDESSILFTAGYWADTQAMWHDIQHGKFNTEAKSESEDAGGILLEDAFERPKVYLVGGSKEMIPHPYSIGEWGDLLLGLTIASLREIQSEDDLLQTVCNLCKSLQIQATELMMVSVPENGVVNVKLRSIYTDKLKRNTFNRRFESSII